MGICKLDKSINFVTFSTGNIFLFVTSHILFFILVCGFEVIFSALVSKNTTPGVHFAYHICSLLHNETFTFVKILQFANISYL